MIDPLREGEAIARHHHGEPVDAVDGVVLRHRVRVAGGPVVGHHEPLAEHALAVGDVGKGQPQAVEQRDHAQHLADAPGQLGAVLAHPRPDRVPRVGDVDHRDAVRGVTAPEHRLERRLQEGVPGSGVDVPAAVVQQVEADLVDAQQGAGRQLGRAGGLLLLEIAVEAADAGAAGSVEGVAGEGRRWPQRCQDDGTQQQQAPAA